jgi:hypothetical protein
MQLPSVTREVKKSGFDKTIMNVYDFDGTIFYSDCSIGFAL